ncbi:MAG TPA: hypothetical protein VFS21_40155 [Roseiflexaceae bacterium]|nr:hypothetical protein [Roseiflexaceae bacterium]
MTEREQLPAAQAGVYVVGRWAAELNDLPLREGRLVWDDPQDPDELVLAVYIVPHHGGLVLVIAERNLYLVDAATFAACCKDAGSVKPPM